MPRAYPDLATTVDLFHALSDPTRIRILSMLTRGERCVCELTDVLDAAQSRLSFHLRTLKEAGVVLDRREGRWMYYRLNPRTVERLREFAGSLEEPQDDRVQLGRRKTG